MPSSRILIASNTLSTSAASVTFSSIPSTYTDLVLKVSARQDGASNGGRFTVRINGDTTTNYSRRGISASGSSVGNIANSNIDYFRDNSSTAANDTTSTFGSGEIYIPNYTGTANKPLSSFSVAENNSTFAEGPTAIAGLYRGSSAITSITVGDFISGWNFISGSTFWLYGLKNS